MQEELIEYRAETQRSTMQSTFLIGLLLASLGVRAVGQFIILPRVGAPNPLRKNQLWWFHVADIVLTAALLPGGADPIHRLMDAFRKFMEASSAKASKTAKKKC